jgi:hypothetical protein
MKKASNEKKFIIYDDRVLPFALIVTGLGIAIILFTIAAYIKNGYINPDKFINATIIGTFGDFIGGFVGTLFSLVTVFLVWLAYQSQKDELNALNEQGKQQTKIQALTALISSETELLSMHNANWQEARGEGNFPYVAQEMDKITASMKIIDAYKKQLTDILEQQNTVTPTVIIKPKKKNKFIRLVKYYFKCFWRLLFPPFK